MGKWESLLCHFHEEKPAREGLRLDGGDGSGQWWGTGQAQRGWAAGNGLYVSKKKKMFGSNTSSLHSSPGSNKNIDLFLGYFRRKIMPVTADILLSYVYLYPLLTFLHDVNFKSLVSLSIWNRLRAHRVLREKTWCTENVLFWMTSWALPQVLQRTKSLPFNSLKFSSRLEIRFKLPFIKVTEWRETGLSRVSFREIAEGTVVRWVWSKLAKTQSRRTLGFQ